MSIVRPDKTTAELKFAEIVGDVKTITICQQTSSSDELGQRLESLGSSHLHLEVKQILSDVEGPLNDLKEHLDWVSQCLESDQYAGYLIWGSLAFIISQHTSQSVILRQVFDHIESLIDSLPTCTHFPNTPHRNSRLHKTISSTFLELVASFAGLVAFSLYHPNAKSANSALPDISAKIKRHVERLGRCTRKVDLEIEHFRESSGPERDRVMVLLENLAVTRRDGARRTESRFLVSRRLNGRFVQRNNILNQIRGHLGTLKPENRTHGSRSVALHGIGGVGKTQVALQYAYMAKEKSWYDLIMWVPSNSYGEIAQAYKDIAVRIGLVDRYSSSTQDSASCMVLVKDWLAENTSSWLIIFDNANDLKVLNHGWTDGLKGSILITTRNHNAALHPADNGIHVKPFDDIEGPQVFLSLLGSGYDSTKDAKLHAQEISDRLGGLPLALNQVATYIQQGRMNLKEFICMYTSDSPTILGTASSGFDHVETVATTWSVSLKTLTGHAATLQKLLAFMSPTEVREELLKNGAGMVRSMTDKPPVDFITNEFQFRAAKTPLLDGALAERDPPTESLSVHQLMQEVVRRELQPAEWTIFFDLAAEILACTWPPEFEGYMYKFWPTCRMCLPHVLQLSELARPPRSPINIDIFTGLLVDAAWLQYEMEEYMECEKLLESCLKFVSPDDSGIPNRYAYAMSIKGLVKLDLHLGADSLGFFEEALEQRLKRLPADHYAIGVGYSNVGLAYADMGKLEQAEEYHKKARDFRERTNCHLMENSTANMAVLLLMQGKPDEAEDLYKTVPGLETLDLANLLNVDKPRWASGAHMIGLCREAQGNFPEALHLAMEVLEFRRQKFGGRFKTCESLCRVGKLLGKTDRPVAGRKFFEECAALASNIPYGEGYAAIANFRLYEGYEHEDRNKAETYLRRAKSARKVAISRTQIHPSAAFAEDKEEAYTSLVPFMLW